MATGEPKAPVEKPGSDSTGAGTDKGSASAGEAAPAGGPRGAVQPQDDDRPPQN